MKEDNMQTFTEEQTYTRAELVQFLRNAVSWFAIPRSFAYQVLAEYTAGDIGTTWEDLADYLDGHGYTDAAEVALLNAGQE